MDVFQSAARLRLTAMSALVAGALLLEATLSRAALPWLRCRAGRYRAAGRYAACEQTAEAVFTLNGCDRYNCQPLFARCAAKYVATWPRLQARAAQPQCDVSINPCCSAARFVDNGDGTVTDNLTALRWEKKTTDSSVHDKSNRYAWSATDTDVAADGTVFTDFLPMLNQGGLCFAGQCDWRVPTVEQLQTILLEPYPCSTIPCIDPVFGPTVYPYLSSTEVFSIWWVDFSDGHLAEGNRSFPIFVRAVRGGL